MKYSPLAVICIFFCLGIWTAKFIHIPFVFAYTSCALFLLSALAGLKKQYLFSLSLSAAVFLAGFLHFHNTQIYPPNHILHFISPESKEVYIRGKVATSPEVAQTFYHARKTTFTLRADDLKIGRNWQNVQGAIRVTVYGKRQVQYGDDLLLQGLLELPPEMRNPGGFDYRNYLANQNIFGLLKVKEKDVFLVLGDTVPIGSKTLSRIKWTTSLGIWRYIEAEQAALLSAILLGERTNLSQDIKDLFISTGTIHILAISGLHIGLITLILVFIFRLLRFPRKAVFVMSIFILINYALLSGGRPSVVRATIMAVIVLLGFLVNREVKIYNSLGMAALTILIYNPNQLFDSGFQLSFLSVISIIYFAPKIEQLFAVAHNRCLFYLIRAFSVSLAAWLGIAPVIAFYFNIVSPIAILANLIVIPCLFLVVSIGVTFLIFAYLWPPLGAIFAGTSWLSLVGLTTVTSLIAKVPLGFFHCPKPTLLFFLSYYALLYLIFNYKKLGISAGKVAIILVLSANILVWPPLFKAPSDKLRVTFLDVGLGDALFIEFPDRGTMLIDGGPATDTNDAARWAILPFLWNRGIEKIDAVVLTHSDNDHVGGLAGVLKNLAVNYVFDNGIPKKSASYAKYKKEAQRVPHYRVLKREEQIYGFPETELFVLHPPRPLLAGTEADDNSNSVVLKLVYGDVSFLFCADIQKEAIKTLLPYGSMLKSTIIKIPHHGSNEEEIEDYLFQEVSAQLAVISVDKNNRFGFPAPEVMKSLKRMGTEVYTTCDHGAVTISTDGHEIWLETAVGAEGGS